MSVLELVRYAYTPTEVQGRLYTDDRVLWTIEKPWVPGESLGGEPFESCVPDGVYSFVHHDRADGTQTVALVNPDLGVWYRKEDRPAGVGRYLILIHAGNYSRDVVGCIAPGLGRTMHENSPMVTSSRAAMRNLNVRQYEGVRITAFKGAIDDG